MTTKVRLHASGKIQKQIILTVTLESHESQTEPSQKKRVNVPDPMPPPLGGTEWFRRTQTFDTLARENAFKFPEKSGSNTPILNDFVKPHIESFNSLFDDAAGHGDGRGLLSLAIKDIGERVVFDGNGLVGTGNGEESGWGNRMSSKLVEWL